MKIAIVGSGIAGLTCAYLLQRQHQITLFEASDWVGGHTHTVDVEVQGQPYSHTMNPLNGQPVRNRLAAVTVVMPSCMLADAWATALLVLGETDGVALAQKRGMDALFVLHNSDGDDGFEEISLVGGQRQA